MIPLFFSFILFFGLFFAFFFFLPGRTLRRCWASVQLFRFNPIEHIIQYRMASAAIAVAADSAVSPSALPAVPPTIPLETYDESGSAARSSKDKGTNTNHIISSPYTTAEHLLDLSTLDAANQFLAQALTTLTPIRPDYATAPYVESFNWNSVFETLHNIAAKQGGKPWTRRSFYVVAFRSVLCADADPDRLHLLDERSHAEAVASGGLLKYWFGSKNEKRENLATCMFILCCPVGPLDIA